MEKLCVITENDKIVRIEKNADPKALLTEVMDDTELMTEDWKKAADRSQYYVIEASKITMVDKNWKTGETTTKEVFKNGV